MGDIRDRAEAYYASSVDPAAPPRRFLNHDQLTGRQAGAFTILGRITNWGFRGTVYLCEHERGWHQAFTADELATIAERQAA